MENHICKFLMNDKIKVILKQIFNISGEFSLCGELVSESQLSFLFVEDAASYKKKGDKSHPYFNM